MTYKVIRFFFWGWGWGWGGEVGCTKRACPHFLLFLTIYTPELSINIPSSTQDVPNFKGSGTYTYEDNIKNRDRQIVQAPWHLKPHGRTELQKEPIPNFTLIKYNKPGVNGKNKKDRGCNSSNCFIGR